MTTYQGFSLIPRDEPVPDLGPNLGFPLDLPAFTLPDGWECHAWAGARGIKVMVRKDEPIWTAGPLAALWIVGMWSDLRAETGRDDDDLRDTVIRAIRRLIVPAIESRSSGD